MSYIEQSLSAGEKVEGLFKLHWFAWIPMVIWIILGVVTFGITWLLPIYEFLRLKFLEQGVTNKRVILKKGIISRTTEEMKLTSIEPSRSVKECSGVSSVLAQSKSRDVASAISYSRESTIQSL